MLKSVPEMVVKKGILAFERIVSAPAAVIKNPAFLSAGSFDIREPMPTRQTIPPIISPNTLKRAKIFKRKRKIPPAA